MIGRWLADALKESVGWEAFKARQETVLTQVLDVTRELAAQVQQCLSSVDAALQTAARVEQQCAELIQRRFDDVALALGAKIDQLEVHAFRQAVDRRLAEITEQVRSIQINQLELSRVGDFTLRVANSIQPSLDLWRSGEGEVAFLPDAGEKPYKVAVISLPKSGTYLMAEVLSELEYVNTHVQAWAYGLHDYRSRSFEQMRHEYLKFHVALPIEVSARLVRSGQFWVGHFEVEQCRQSLRDFKKIFMIRDLRFTLVSYMRWLSIPGRGGVEGDAWRHLPDTEEKFLPFFETHGRAYLAWCRDIVDWRDVDDVLILRFEDVTGLNGERVQAEVIAALSRLLGEAEPAVAAAVRESIGRETKTFSGRYSTLAEVWSERVQELFVEAGGEELNRLLGYPQERPSLRRAGLG